MREYEGALRVELEPFLRSWGPINWRTHVEGFRPPRNLPVAVMLRTLAHIENVSFLLQPMVRASGVVQSRAVEEFNAVWLAEESEHARALHALAVCYWPEVGALTTEYRTRFRSFPSFHLLKLFGLYSRGILGAYLALGSIQEYVAVTTYRSLSDILDEGPAKNILQQIARQEVRHMRFYRQGAKAVLGDSVATQRLVRYLACKHWSPPGLVLLGLSRWVEVFRPLIETEGLRARYARVDELIRSLPGLDGVTLVEPFFTRCAGSLAGHNEGG